MAAQTIADLEKKCEEYITLVFPRVDEVEEPVTWLESDENENFVQRFAEHRMYDFRTYVPTRSDMLYFRLCNEMRVEVSKRYLLLGCTRSDDCSWTTIFLTIS